MQHGIGEIAGQSHLLDLDIFSKPTLISSTVLPCVCEREREREREFYLTPVGPGYRHMAADAAEATYGARK